MLTIDSRLKILHSVYNRRRRLVDIRLRFIYNGPSNGAYVVIMRDINVNCRKT